MCLDTRGRQGVKILDIFYVNLLHDSQKLVELIITEHLSRKISLLVSSEIFYIHLGLIGF